MLGFPDPVPLLDTRGGGTEPCFRTEEVETLNPHGGLWALQQSGWPQQPPRRACCLVLALNLGHLSVAGACDRRAQGLPSSILEYRCSLIHFPVTHLVQCSPVPNRPWTSTWCAGLTSPLCHTEGPPVSLPCPPHHLQPHH